MAVQVQWNLDYAVGAALTVGLDIFRAASRNNVQPLAILACEKFGNTVAMCQDTCRKVERAMITPEAVPIAFLRATVGFFADDCGTQLSRSLAGLQFLGLATALVSSMGPFESGLVLELLLKKSTSDRTLLPTARQLKDLLEAIEPRCNPCGFADSIVGWRVFLCGNTLLTNIEGRLKASWTMGGHRPSDEGIESFVDGLRQIARIGEARKCILSVFTTLCAPWVIAFTKWCLGSPPTVIFDDNGKVTTILDSPESLVFVIIGAEIPDSDGFRMSVSSSLADITDIVTHAEKLSSWPQLTTIETYGKLRLREIEFDSGTANRALCQALPYCIHQVVGNLRFKSEQEIDDDDDDSHLPKPNLNPFPRDHAIFSLACRIMGIKELAESNSLEQGIGISDLPVVKLHLEKLASECGCDKCGSTPRRFELESFYGPCLMSKFFYNLGSIIAEVMALSPFSHSESLLVRSISFLGMVPAEMKFAGAVTTLIMRYQGCSCVCSISELLRLALRLVGHFSPENDSDTQDRWIMSSKRGQAVYLSILDTYEISERGYLSLEWLPGLIRCEGDIYDTVLAQTAIFVQSHMSEHLREIPVLIPANLSPYKFAWWIEKQEGYLEVSVGSHDKKITSLTRSPRQIIDNLANVRVLGACSHSSNSSLVEADSSCTYTLPLEPRLEVKDRPSHVSVVASAGKQQLRFLALNGDNEPRRMVMRMDTCLSCCLKYCRLNGFDVVIL